MNLQSLSSEEIYALLQRQKLFVASETFADYVVTTMIEQDAQGCRFRTSVTWQGKELTDTKELAPAQGDAGMQSSKESSLLYIEDARVKHADKCHTVRNRVRKEQHRKGRRSLAVCAALLIVVAAAVIAVYPKVFNLFSPTPTPVAIQAPTPLPSPTPAGRALPDLQLQFTAVRSTLNTNQQTGTTMILSKDDVLTITVIDAATGTTVAQEIVNLRIAK